MYQLSTDLATLARASWAVASSDTMPRCDEWMSWSDSHRRSAPRENPPPTELARRLEEVVDTKASRVDDRLPRHGGQALPSRRLVAGLVSFVDDYHGPMPHEMFPSEATRALRLALRARAEGGVLTLDEQLGVALEIVDGHLLSAAVCLHAATRLVARDRDSRALGPLSWEERLIDGAWIAPFPQYIAGRGDAPGDTYHYWANFVAGLHIELSGGLVPWAVGAMFLAGPAAMTLVRGRIFGATLFAGAHARCDWMGLSHGRAVARACRRS